MKRIGKTTIFVVLALVLALGAFGLFRPRLATAVEPGLYLIDDPNVKCATLNGYTDPGFAGITSDFGFKIDGVPIEDAIY